jgi:two-component sensor histidine kinase
VVEERTAALAQRDLLLREVYHRVKNNLQIVDSMLLMQARRLKDPDAKTALENLRGRVYALGLVHHQLMGSKDLETFDVAPFLEELSRHLLEGAGRAEVGLSVRATPLKVGLDFAIPLGLLVTELVTNSMKHAFDGGPGAIDVTLEDAEAGEVVLQVSDNGRGYDPAAAGATPSLGASIVDGLVRQLRGVLTISGDGGTRSVVRLPAPVQA